MSCIPRWSLIMGCCSSAAHKPWLNKVKMNLVPSPADCFVGPASLNVEGICVRQLRMRTGDAVEQIEAAAKERLELKVKIKGVTDVTGALITTARQSRPSTTCAEACVQHLPNRHGSPPLCDDPSNVYLKVGATGGARSCSSARFRPSVPAGTRSTSWAPPVGLAGRGIVSATTCRPASQPVSTTGHVKHPAPCAASAESSQ
jgi:hypothetical protein